MDMTSWCAENAVESKLEACLERIRVSRMWWIFDGLQKGSCTIKVVHDGDRIDFVPTKARKVKAEPAVEPTIEEQPSMEASIQVMEDTQIPEEALTGDIPIPIEEVVEEEPEPTVDVTSKLKPKRRDK